MRDPITEERRLGAKFQNLRHISAYVCIVISTKHCADVDEHGLPHYAQSRS